MSLNVEPQNQLYDVSGLADVTDFFFCYCYKLFVLLGAILVLFNGFGETVAMCSVRDALSSPALPFFLLLTLYPSHLWLLSSEEFLFG